MDEDPFVDAVCPDCGHPVTAHIGDADVGLMCSVDGCGCVGLTNDEHPVILP